MYRRPVELRGGSDGILEEAEAGEVDLDSEDCQGDQRGEDADGDLPPIVVGGADFGIEEAGQEVAHQLEGVAVGLFQPLAQVVHTYFTSNAWWGGPPGPVGKPGTAIQFQKRELVAVPVLRRTSSHWRRRFMRPPPR